MQPLSLEELKALQRDCMWNCVRASDGLCAPCRYLFDEARTILSQLIAQLEWREGLKKKVDGMKLEPRETTKIYVAGVNDAVAGVLSLLDQNT